VDPKHAHVVGKIQDEAREVYTRISRKQKPQMKLPIRSLANVKYHPKAGFFQLHGKEQDSHAYRRHGSHLRPDAKDAGDEQGTGRDAAALHKREAYYQAYNWGEAAFGQQEESTR